MFSLTCLLIAVVGMPLSFLGIGCYLLIEDEKEAKNEKERL
jgi:hypothetical protein